jgi:hypothetical protein
VYVNVADTATHELLPLDKEENFRILGHDAPRQSFEREEHLLAVTEISAGELAHHERVRQHLRIAQERNQTIVAVAKVIHPYGGVNDDHAARVLRRRAGSSCGSEPPSRAKRRALSRSISAASASRISAGFCEMPVMRCASASNRSSKVTVVRINTSRKCACIEFYIM